MTADEARARVGEIRDGLRRAMRLLCRPGVDWDAAAGHLYRAERTCRVGCYPPGYEDNLHYEVCSECGTILTASRPGDRHAARASYCPNCGARIVKEEA